MVNRPYEILSCVCKASFLAKSEPIYTDRVFQQIITPQDSPLHESNKYGPLILFCLIQFIVIGQYIGVSCVGPYPWKPWAIVTV